MRKIISKLPLLNRLFSGHSKPRQPFSSSGEYWEQRYQRGKNSGAGSYNHLAEFKAETLNRFVADQQISTVIEYGCGDGNQLSLAEYPSYIGFDVSAKAISICEQHFASDPSKTFKLMDSYSNERAELTLSLDVVYHLVEDAVFENYMARLFDSAERFVIIYSSNTDNNTEEKNPHVRHRQFSRWVESNRPEFALIQHIPNRYPFKGDNKTGSFADFYIYERSIAK